MLDRLIKISSISSAILIFLGVLKLIIYYSAFNIAIVDFLTFSEILTSFLDDINILLIFGIIMLLISLVTIDFLHRKTKYDFDEFMTKFFDAIYPLRKKFVILFCIAIILLLVLLYSKVVSLNYLVIYLLIFCILQLLFYLVMKKNKTNEVYVSEIATIFIGILAAGTSIFLLSEHDIQQTKKNTTTVKITLEKSIIECSGKTNNLYLGKTDNFIFIKIDSSNSTISLPITQVKQLEFK